MFRWLFQKGCPHSSIVEYLLLPFGFDPKDIGTFDPETGTPFWECRICRKQWLRGEKRPNDDFQN